MTGFEGGSDGPLRGKSLKERAKMKKEVEGENLEPQTKLVLSQRGQREQRERDANQELDRAVAGGSKADREKGGGSLIFITSLRASILNDGGKPTDEVVTLEGSGTVTGSMVIDNDPNKKVITFEAQSPDFKKLSVCAPRGDVVKAMTAYKEEFDRSHAEYKKGLP